DVDWELVDMSVAALIRYIEEYDLLRVMSKIFLDPTMGARAQSFTNVLELLVHCTTCVAPNCHYVKTEAYINALRHALEKDQLWADTLIRLEQRQKSSVKKSEGAKVILQRWYMLGKEIGLVQRQATLAPPVPSTSSQPKPADTKVRESVDGCWNTDCEKNGVVDEAVESKLLRCSSCKVARYCSAVCQTRDWKAGHKGECKALKAKAG
ncbi:11934_t:CDS:2, partial [Acaulospora colombiana]